MPKLMKSYQEVVQVNRDHSYRIFGQNAILYPPDGNQDLPVYIVSCLYLSVPFAFTQMEARLNGAETHLSIRMMDVANNLDLEDWEVLVFNQEMQLKRGIVDAVLVDDTMGEINLKYKIIDDAESSKTAVRRSYH